MVTDIKYRGSVKKVVSGVLSRIAANIGHDLFTDPRTTVFLEEETYCRGLSVELATKTEISPANAPTRSHLPRGGPDLSVDWMSPAAVDWLKLQTGLFSVLTCVACSKFQAPTNHMPAATTTRGS